MRRLKYGACSPLLLFVLLTLGPAAQAAAANTGPPSIVMILTDDQDSALTGGDWFMPIMHRQIAQKGVNFTNSIVNFALCCPSRSTILAGQCAHNTGVISNDGPLGGMTRFNERGLENKTVPYLLQQAGYRTGLVGKYLNGYWPDFPASYIPPGYDTWFGMRKQGQYGWSASDQGVEREYGKEPSDHSTAVITRRAVRFIQQAKKDPRPFWLYVAPFVPHSPQIPLPQHVGKLAGLKVPRVPSWNQSDASIRKMATRVVRKMLPLDAELEAEYDFRYQKRAETLLGVDDQIQAIVQALIRTNRLSNTFIFYASDNGYKLGHRRKTEKCSPYEEDIRVPLYVRGPKVPRGIKLPHLVSNIDYLPTWLELAGVADPYADSRDGKSFAPLLVDASARRESPDNFRIGLLIEKLYGFGSRNADKVSTLVPMSASLDSVFAGYRLEKLPNGSFPIESAMVAAEDVAVDDEADQISATNFEMLACDLRHHAVLQFSATAAKKGVVLAAGTYRGAFNDAYYGLRIQSTAGRYKYIEYRSGYELYDLDQDPYEVNNIYKHAPQSLKDFLQASLDSLKVCAGQSCSVKNVSLLIEARQQQQQQ